MQEKYLAVVDFSCGNCQTVDGGKKLVCSFESMEDGQPIYMKGGAKRCQAAAKDSSWI